MVVVVGRVVVGRVVVGRVVVGRVVVGRVVVGRVVVGRVVVGRVVVGRVVVGRVVVGRVVVGRVVVGRVVVGRVVVGRGVVGRGVVGRGGRVVGTGAGAQAHPAMRADAASITPNAFMRVLSDARKRRSHGRTSIGVTPPTLTCVQQLLNTPSGAVSRRAHSTPSSLSAEAPRMAGMAARTSLPS